ncbi:hypothetical protein L596_015564 [Steinernema carpocapsae]|uniref:Nematode cuticle collagen N-terminal domain-containing protein n=1 Tax=Steinernema carpocapsae TaxID=34508 RepID=A0A4U5NGD1_STECR|nr:hypothetical protein L596_015564 [Steinernema carpocapsae]
MSHSDNEILTSKRDTRRFVAEKELEDYNAEYDSQTRLIRNKRQLQTCPPTVPGPPGPPGDDGIDGESGDDGPVGKRGIDARIMMLEEQKKCIVCPTGPVGPVGVPGPQGLQGLKGDKGLSGMPAADGIDGEVGTEGPVGYSGEPGKPGSKGTDGRPAPGGTGSRGPKGLKGPIGRAGLQGSRGKRNFVYGPPGPDGKPGMRGLDGLEGSIGGRGERGLMGEPGANAKFCPCPQELQKMQAKRIQKSEKLTMTEAPKAAPEVVNAVPKTVQYAAKILGVPREATPNEIEDLDLPFVVKGPSKEATSLLEQPEVLPVTVPQGALDDDSLDYRLEGETTEAQPTSARTSSTTSKKLTTSLKTLPTQASILEESVYEDPDYEVERNAKLVPLHEGSVRRGFTPSLTTKQIALHDGDMHKTVKEFTVTYPYVRGMVANDQAIPMSTEEEPRTTTAEVAEENDVTEAEDVDIEEGQVGKQSDDQGEEEEQEEAEESSDSASETTEAAEVAEEATTKRRFVYVTKRPRFRPTVSIQ